MRAIVIIAMAVTVCNAQFFKRHYKLYLPEDTATLYRVKSTVIEADTLRVPHLRQDTLDADTATITKLQSSDVKADSISSGSLRVGTDHVGVPSRVIWTNDSQYVDDATDTLQLGVGTSGNRAVSFSSGFFSRGKTVTWTCDVQLDAAGQLAILFQANTGSTFYTAMTTLSPAQYHLKMRLYYKGGSVFKMTYETLSDAGATTMGYGSMYYSSADSITVKPVIYLSDVTDGAGIVEKNTIAIIEKP